MFCEVLEMTHFFYKYTRFEIKYFKMCLWFPLNCYFDHILDLTVERMYILSTELVETCQSRFEKTNAHSNKT